MATPSRQPVTASTGSGYQSDPALAFDGTNYLVVWSDGREDYNIYGARVSRQVACSTPAGSDLAPATQYAPALAFDGTNYLVVWQDPLGLGRRLRRAREPGGGGARPGRHPDLDGAERPASPALAFDGTNYLVAWAGLPLGTSSDIYGARVSPAGAVLDRRDPDLDGADDRVPRVAFDGTNYLVAWEDYRSDTGSRRLRRPRQPGRRACSTRTAFPISTAAERPVARRSPSTARTTSSSGRTYRGHELRHLRARVSPAGTVLDPAGIAISTAASDQYARASRSTGRTISSSGATSAGRATTSTARVSAPGNGARPGRDPDLGGIGIPRGIRRLPQNGKGRRPLPHRIPEATTERASHWTRFFV